RTNFRLYAVIEFHRKVMWLRRLPVVAESQSTCIFIDHQASKLRHQRKNGTAIHPRTTMVHLLKTSDGIGFVLIFPPVSVFTGLCRKEMHAEWHPYGWVRIAVRQGPFGIGTL